MKRNRQIKFGTFVCQCGCAKTFTAEYVTRAPQYLDKKHRNRKLAANKAAARKVATAALFKKYKERRKLLAGVKIKSGKALDMAMSMTESEFSYVLRRLELLHETSGGHPDD